MSGLGRRAFMGGLAGAAAGSLVSTTAWAQAPIAQSVWMTALLRELGLLPAGGKAPSAPELVQLLGAPRAATFTAAELAFRTATVQERKILLASDASERWLSPADGGGAATVVFRHQAQRPGRQLVLFRMRGGPHLVSFGAKETRGIELSGEETGVATLAFDPGPMDIAISMAPGGALERLVVHPEAGSPLSPPGGWKPDAVLTYGAKAATLVRLGGWEDELPPAEGGPRALPIIGGYDNQGRSVRRIRLETPGVYTLAARISGTPPTAILLDDALLLPTPGIAGISPAAGKTGTLVSLGTLFVDDQDHELAFHGAGGAIHELLQLRRVSADARYLAIARAHGFERSGPDATAAPGASVGTAALGRNVSSLRAFLAGPIAAPSRRTATAQPLPTPPARPQAISPLLPGDGR